MATVMSLVLVVFVALVSLVSVEAVKVNIIHTTDIHGWVAGHPHNATLDADFGDFHSLLLHMQANAIKNGEEFLLFDTGDLIEGTGMSDATPVHGQYIFEIIKNVSTYNGLTMGNHDIGHPEVVTLMQQSFIPFWNGSYVTGNSVMAATHDFIGAPFSVFTTSLGTKILLLGYLFNFTHEANNTIVVPVSISLTDPYFADAMEVADVDMIVVCSHIAPQFGPELGEIYSAVRKSHPQTPLVMLAGHSHVTYFETLDPNAFVIESGKYFEVIGVINFEIAENGNMESLETQWVETSVAEFMKLSGTTSQTFDTPQGQLTSQLVQYVWNLLGLNITYGCAPTTYYAFSDYVTDPENLYKLYIEEVMPKTVFTTATNDPFFISNTAALRYNLYEGPVNRNDIYTISPFNDTFVVYPAMPGKDLKVLMKNIMNTSGLAHELAMSNRYCGVADYSTPNWYYSSVWIFDHKEYDVILASYDAETIYPVVQQLFNGQKFAQFVTFPTEFNSTGALQTYIQTMWPCRS